MQPSGGPRVAPTDQGDPEASFRCYIRGDDESTPRYSFILLAYSGHEVYDARLIVDGRVFTKRREVTKGTLALLVGQWAALARSLPPPAEGISGPCEYEIVLPSGRQHGFLNGVREPDGQRVALLRHSLVGTAAESLVSQACKPGLDLWEHASIPSRYGPP